MSLLLRCSFVLLTRHFVEIPADNAPTVVVLAAFRFLPLSATLSHNTACSTFHLLSHIYKCLETRILFGFRPSWVFIRNWEPEKWLLFFLRCVLLYVCLSRDLFCEPRLFFRSHLRLCIHVWGFYSTRRFSPEKGLFFTFALYAASCGRRVVENAGKEGSGHAERMKEEEQAKKHPAKFYGRKKHWKGQRGERKPRDTWGSFGHCPLIWEG
jgi:hypothetical protein